MPTPNPYDIYRSDQQDAFGQLNDAIQWEAHNTGTMARGVLDGITDAYSPQLSAAAQLSGPAAKHQTYRLRNEMNATRLQALRLDDELAVALADAEGIPLSSARSRMIHQFRVARQEWAKNPEDINLWPVLAANRWAAQRLNERYGEIEAGVNLRRKEAHLWNDPLFVLNDAIKGAGMRVASIPQAMAMDPEAYQVWTGQKEIPVSPYLARFVRGLTGVEMETDRPMGEGFGGVIDPHAPLPMQIGQWLTEPIFEIGGFAGGLIGTAGALKATGIAKMVGNVMGAKVAAPLIARTMGQTAAQQAAAWARYPAIANALRSGSVFATHGGIARGLGTTQFTGAGAAFDPMLLGNDFLTGAFFGAADGFVEDSLAKWAAGDTESFLGRMGHMVLGEGVGQGSDDAAKQAITRGGLGAVLGEDGLASLRQQMAQIAGGANGNAMAVLERGLAERGVTLDKALLNSMRDDVRGILETGWQEQVFADGTKMMADTRKGFESAMSNAERYLARTHYLGTGSMDVLMTRAAIDAGTGMLEAKVRGGSPEEIALEALTFAMYGLHQGAVNHEAQIHARRALSEGAIRELSATFKTFNDTRRQIEEQATAIIQQQSQAAFAQMLGERAAQAPGREMVRGMQFGMAPQESVAGLVDRAMVGAEQAQVLGQGRQAMQRQQAADAFGALEAQAGAQQAFGALEQDAAFQSLAQDARRGGNVMADEQARLNAAQAEAQRMAQTVADLQQAVHQQQIEQAFATLQNIGLQGAPAAELMGGLDELGRIAIAAAADPQNMQLQQQLNAVRGRIQPFVANAEWFSSDAQAVRGLVDRAYNAEDFKGAMEQIRRTVPQQQPAPVEAPIAEPATSAGVRTEPATLGERVYVDDKDIGVVSRDGDTWLTLDGNSVTGYGFDSKEAAIAFLRDETAISDRMRQDAAVRTEPAATEPQAAPVEAQAPKAEAPATTAEPAETITPAVRDAARAIKKAYFDLSAGKTNEPVMIADVRDAVGSSVSPSDFDAAILMMNRTKDMVPFRRDLPHRITKRDRAAAVKVIGDEFHEVYAQHGGNNFESLPVVEPPAATPEEGVWEPRGGALPSQRAKTKAAEPTPPAKPDAPALAKQVEAEIAEAEVAAAEEAEPAAPAKKEKKRKARKGEVPITFAEGAEESLPYAERGGSFASLKQHASEAIDRAITGEGFSFTVKGKNAAGADAAFSVAAPEGQPSIFLGADEAIAESPSATRLVSRAIDAFKNGSIDEITVENGGVATITPAGDGKFRVDSIYTDSDDATVKYDDLPDDLKKDASGALPSVIKAALDGLNLAEKSNANAGKARSTGAAALVELSLEDELAAGRAWLNDDMGLVDRGDIPKQLQRGIKRAQLIDALEGGRISPDDIARRMLGGNAVAVMRIIEEGGYGDARKMLVEILSDQQAKQSIVDSILRSGEDLGVCIIG